MNKEQNVGHYRYNVLKKQVTVPENANTATIALGYGAEILVVGHVVYNKTDRAAAIFEILQAAQKA